MKQLVPVSSSAPGSLGLNKEQADRVMPWEFAADASNMVINSSGQLESRKGIGSNSGNIAQTGYTWDKLHEFRQADGTSTMISAHGNNKIMSGGWPDSAYTDITGIITVSGSNWQFLNYEDKVIGVQQGHTPIVWDGTGTFAHIAVSSGTIPTGNCGVAAYGRLWIADSDRKTIKYCNLLDETDWTNNAGSILMEHIWENDEIINIAALNSKLYVFGKRHIVVIGDETTGAIALDPSTMIVEDVIKGTGLVGRDSLVTIADGDALYLSPNGIQSLSRTLIQPDNPVHTVCEQVSSYINDLVAQEPEACICSTYHAKEGWYLLQFPMQARIIVVHTRLGLEGSFVVTDWDLSGVLTNLFAVGFAYGHSDGTLLFGMGSFSIMAYYGEFKDGLSWGSAFTWKYSSGWLPLHDDGASIAILKKLSLLLEAEAVASGASNTVTIKTYKDFDPTVLQTITISDVGENLTVSEWDVAEWSDSDADDEWEDRRSFVTHSKNLIKTAKFFKVEVSGPGESNASFGNLNILSKRGRAAL